MMQNDSTRCSSCERELSNDETAFSKKILGRKTEMFYCIDCISEKLGISKKESLEMIENLKEQKCDLFSDNCGA